ncbi:hypothetical protein POSPLADRAFT_1149659 [Postia placenta MAD-698-R-SB12]|uniref:CMP/dCMP-type deaminase domain-containing protein n=1 Tax=Postia placenta MAD-698-R-SB12 TaxID=670580 RepID=A0A1X6MUU7_9APHY|nr:hypothetical protein POSPLADRAFT_1149659 [Postia placenta MAD-698-R-SB12]OSX60030.1 hypothetical protein POSPLADRAFT_1149659 [Postia placenta MAD-698-R-SB12]
MLDPDPDSLEEVVGRFIDGDLDDLIPEENLPFTHLKLVQDEEEEVMSAVRTEQAWVVALPDPKQAADTLKWLKISGLETADMDHLKRIRKQSSQMTLLLTYTRTHPSPPSLPPALALPAPYTLLVPRSAALTQTSLQLKNTLWPTVYAPRRKHEAEPWARARVQWACAAMRRVVQEARAARARGELPIAAYVPVPHDDETRAATQLSKPLIAGDTRVSAAHPLRHAVLNAIRAVAEYRAALPDASPPPASADAVSEDMREACEGGGATRNGTHYLLTSLTLFTTHEPCIMCSMALLHSRVKEVFYLIPMDKTGGCGGAACVPGLKGVNHRYAINRWRAGRDWAVECGLEVGPGTDA